MWCNIRLIFDMCHVYMWYIQWGLVVVLAGLKGSGSGVVCVLEGCQRVEWVSLYIQLLCSGFIFNVRWQLWWSHLLAVLEKVNLLLEGTVCSVVNSCRKGKREKGKWKRERRDLFFIPRERSSIIQTRMVEWVSWSSWEKMYPVWLVAVRAVPGVGAMLVSLEQHQSGPGKDWGALWVEDPAKLSQRHHLSVAFPFRCNR